MSKTKFAEDMTAFGLSILFVILIIIMMTSCATTKSSYYQDHLKSTHHKNFVSKDNGGCGWNN
jgi:biopolymer transport protein ExbD